MTMDLGYLTGTAIFLSVLVVLVVVQIAAKKFHPLLYWSVIVASTTAGTTLADFATRSLGIGYMGGSLLLFGCLMAVLALWYWSEGSVSVATVNAPKAEAFYWAAITFSQTLGTALGDWIADAGLGYGGAALVFAAGLAVLTAAYYWTNVSRVTLFWAAFILTRPLRRDGRRLSRQATRSRRPGAEPPLGFARPCGLHDCLRAAAAAKAAFILDRLRSGEASRRPTPYFAPSSFMAIAVSRNSTKEITWPCSTSRN